MNSSYSIVMQAGLHDCGPACLAAIAHTHGLWFAPEELPSAATEGASLLELARAARSIGFEAQGVRMPISELDKIPLPAIAHLDLGDEPGGRGHYVVVHALHEDGFTVADPSQGIRFMPRSVFARIWSGQMLLLRPNRETPLPLPSEETRNTAPV
jgi:ATP-binding cassette subfamily B protein